MDIAVLERIKKKRPEVLIIKSHKFSAIAFLKLLRTELTFI